MSAKQNITNSIKDLVSDLLYYDRKEDEELSVDDINNAFKDGTITVDEAVEIFKNELINKTT